MNTRHDDFEEQDEVQVDLPWGVDCWMTIPDAIETQALLAREARDPAERLRRLTEIDRLKLLEAQP